MLDGPLQVSFEMLEAQPARVDIAAPEGLLDERLELDEAEHRDRALPTLPDEAVAPRLEVGIARPQEARSLCARQLVAQGQHGERLAHPRAYEFVCLRLQDHVVERLRIAIENRGHDPMAGLRGR